jgi:UDP-N-acetylmuramoyl-tripeptide--D-alanyl-D-alanine ligase
MALMKMDGGDTAAKLVLAGANLPRGLLGAGLRLKEGLARVQRLLAGRTCFIGVTGSCGKTTTKRLIGAVVSRRGPTRVSWTATNSPDRVASTILTVFPWHRFCVQEMGGFAPGVLARSAALVRPRIGVVTRVAHDHYTAFRGLERTAREKSVLVRALPAGGTAILNADDPRVLAMGGLTGARVITYGLAPEAMVRGSAVSSVWPGPLSLSVAAGRDRVRVRTRLFGEHWASAVLAAMATGLAVGIPLGEAASAVETVEPTEGRTSVLRVREGPVFILDTWKAPLWTIPAVVRLLAGAKSARKFAVFGTISDFPGASQRRYLQVARESLAVADSVWFVGPNAHLVLKEKGKAADRLAAFNAIREFAVFLKETLRPGDLVLLKGSGRDHLERLALDWVEAIRCWRTDCRLSLHCGRCRRRSRPAASRPDG